MFIKQRKRIQKVRETGDLKNLYRKKLDKACFFHDSANSDSKDLAKRTFSGKIFKDRAHEIARNLTYDGCQRGLANMVHKCFGKKTV